MVTVPQEQLSCGRAHLRRWRRSDLEALVSASRASWRHLQRIVVRKAHFLGGPGRKPNWYLLPRRELVQDIPPHCKRRRGRVVNLRHGRAAKVETPMS